MKLRPETDGPEIFLSLEHVDVGARADSARRWRVLDARLQPSKHGITVLLHLGGSDTREDAEALRGSGVYVEEEMLPPLDPDEWFLDELIGLSVRDSGGEDIGVVEDVLELPAHPTMSVRRSTGHVLIPAISPFVVSVDLESQRIIVELPEGLIDI